MNTVKNILIYLFLSFFLYAYSPAQEVFNVKEGSEVKIDGSSTVSDWSAVVKEFSGKLSLPSGFTGADGQKAEHILLVMQVKSIDGGRGVDMNAKILNAFKGEEFPQITFESATGICSPTEDNSFTMKCMGVLKMAGASQEIELITSGKATADGFEISGSHALDMTAFGMEPPTAFFGSLEVKKEVVVKFNILVSS